MSNALADLPLGQQRFDGATFDPDHDGGRLTSQLDRVRVAMTTGAWFSLDVLVSRCGGTTASISARLRDLRKPRFGGHTVERRRVAGGHWVYRLVELRKRTAL